MLRCGLRKFNRLGDNRLWVHLIQPAYVFEYADGRRTGLWPGLAAEFPTAAEQPPLVDLEDRYLVIEALETARCFEEQVITSAAAANIGSIMGIGYPPLTGGTVTYMENFEGGLAGFVARARELAATYGVRFEPPASLVQMAEKGERFPR